VAVLRRMARWRVGIAGKHSVVAGCSVVHGTDRLRSTALCRRAVGRHYIGPVLKDTWSVCVCCWTGAPAWMQRT
jgi:hypothetical protein